MMDLVGATFLLRGQPSKIYNQVNIGPLYIRMHGKPPGVISAKGWVSQHPTISSCLFFDSYTHNKIDYAKDDIYKVT